MQHPDPFSKAKHAGVRSGAGTRWFRRLLGGALIFALLCVVLLAYRAGPLFGSKQLDRFLTSLASDARQTAARGLRALPSPLAGSVSKDYPARAPFPADDQCLSRLTTSDVHQVTAMAPITSGATRPCGSHDPVRVTALSGVALSSPTPMGCKAAETLATWLAQDVPKLTDQLGLSPPTTLHHIGTYNCRRIAGSQTWSQHAFANAIDIAGIDVPDLGRVTLQDDYLAEPDKAGDKDAVLKAKLLLALRDSLCKRFRVVLGPEFNSAHADHFHLDLGPYRQCK